MLVIRSIFDFADILQHHNNVTTLNTRPVYPLRPRWSRKHAYAIPSLCHHHPPRTTHTNTAPDRRSSIAHTWANILSSSSTSTSNNKLVLTSSPADHYAASKTERRRHSSSRSEGGRKSSVEGRRRASSLWSRETGETGMHESRWGRLFKMGKRDKHHTDGEKDVDTE